MKRGVVVQSVLNGCNKLLVLEEIAILDCLGNTGEFLIDNAACAHIHVAYFGVAHLAVRKTYCHTCCIAFLERAGSFQLVHNRRICHRYGIMLNCVAESVTIEDH